MNPQQRKYAVERLDVIFYQKAQKLFDTQLAAATALADENKVTINDLHQYLLSNNLNFLLSPETTISLNTELSKLIDVTALRKFVNKEFNLPHKHINARGVNGYNWYFDSYDKYEQLAEQVAKAKDRIMFFDAAEAAQAIEEFSKIEFNY